MTIKKQTFVRIKKSGGPELAPKPQPPEKPSAPQPGHLSKPVRTETPSPSASEEPAILSCGEWKAGDEIILPYTKEKVTIESFVESADYGFYAVFKKGCIRVEALKP